MSKSICPRTSPGYTARRRRAKVNRAKRGSWPFAEQQNFICPRTSPGYAARRQCANGNRAKRGAWPFAEGPCPEGAKNRVCTALQNQTILYSPPYLTRIEGPPPKRNVVSSSLAGGAKTGTVQRQSRFFIPKNRALAQKNGMDSPLCLAPEPHLRYNRINKM